MADTKKYLDLAGLQSYDTLIKGVITAEANRAKGVEGTLTDLTTDAKTSLVAAINEVDSHADANTAAIGTDTTEGTVKYRVKTLEDAIGAGGSVATQIKEAIEALDSTKEQAAGTDGLALKIVETDGKITSIEGSIAANTYDAHGAAATAKSEVIGASTDAKDANTVYGAKAFATDAVSTLNNSLKAVAKSGAAADVAIADTQGLYVATTVEGALEEIAKTEGLIATAVDGLAKGAVKSNTDAIAAINNETTGILAQAKTYTNTSIGSLGDKSEGVAYADVKDYVDTKVAGASTAGAVTLATAETATEGYLKTYVISQGGSEVGKIDIPKDMVVTSGEVVVNPEGQPEGTYIKLTIANQTNPIFINVKDLVDIYTAAQGATQVQLAVSATNEISATLVAGGVNTTELADKAVTNAKIADATIARAKIDAAFEAQIVALETASTTGVDGKIQTAIEALDSTKSQSASETNALSLSIVETDGKITSISGDIETVTTDDINALFVAK